jgi:transcriptional regulator with XRE-family HTH domain
MLLGLRIKQLRSKKNISVTDFAEKIGVVRQTVYDYESNKTEPSLDTLRKICTTLEVTLVDLFKNTTELEYELNPLGGTPPFIKYNMWAPNEFSFDKLTKELNSIKTILERQNQIIDRLTRMLENAHLGKPFDVILGGLASLEAYSEAVVVEMYPQGANSVTSEAKSA